MICVPLFWQFIDNQYAGLGDCRKDDDVVDISIRDSTRWTLDFRCLDIGFVQSTFLRLQRAPYSLERRALTFARHYRLVPKHLLAGYMSSETLTRRAQIMSWFDTCGQHAECRTKRTLFCPTRLVEIGPTWQRVIEHPPQDAVYLTLSHRWTTHEATLRTDNIEELKEGIAELKLSVDVAAGIAWTRTLGFQYLWVDTLCITQDSEEDWQKEAKQMADIYRHGWCTLSSSDGTALSVQPNEKPVSIVHELRTSWSFEGNSQWYLIDTGYWRLDWQEQELNRRGWVFQESFLSHRVIHFHGEQLLWQCGGMTASETFPTGFPPEDLVGEVQAGFVLAGDKSNQRMEAVTRYSRRQFTYGKDKLIAFAGIGAHLQSSKWYYAGLWDHNAIGQLLWRVNSTAQMDGRPTCYCVDAKAPSWSWANVDAMIECDGHCFNERPFSIRSPITWHRPFTWHQPLAWRNPIKRREPFAWHLEIEQGMSSTESAAEAWQASSMWHKIRAWPKFFKLPRSVEWRRPFVQHVSIVSIHPKTLELRMRGILIAHAPHCPLEVGINVSDDSVIPDIHDKGSRDQFLPPHELPRDLRYLYMQSKAMTDDLGMRCLALLALPNRQGFYVRFGVVKADRAKACAYLRDVKHRCGRDAYMPERHGLLTIV
ncbi:hypothetical protein LTR95_014877 [Oleoguttula sp. CCFEE 5521]